MASSASEPAPLIGVTDVSSSARSRGSWDRARPRSCPQQYVDARHRRPAGIALLLPRRSGRRGCRDRRLDGLDRSPAGRRRARAVRRGAGIRSPTRPRRPRRAGSSRCSAPRSDAACRCSRSAAGSSSSTSPAAARCTSTCPSRSAPRLPHRRRRLRRDRRRGRRRDARSRRSRRRPVRRAQLPPPGRSTALGDGLVGGGALRRRLVQAFGRHGDRASRRRPMAPRGERRGPTPLRRSRRTGSCVRRTAEGGRRDERVHSSINPSTEAVDPRGRGAPASARSDAAIARAVAAQRRLGGARPGRPRPTLLRRFARGGRRRTSSTSRSSRWPTPGTDRHPRAGRRATSRDVLNYYSAAPERLFGRQIPVAGGIDVTFHEPLRRRRRDRAVELPDDDRRAGRSRRRSPRATRWCSSRPSSRRSPRSASASSRSRRACPTDVFQVRHRAGSVVGQRLRRAPRRAQGRVHRLDRGRHRGRRRAAPDASSRSRSSSAARAPTSSSPTPTSSGRRPPRPAPCSTTPARTAAPAAGILVQRSVYDRFMELLEPAVNGVARGRPVARRHRDGPAHLGRAPRHRSRRSSTARDVAFRGTAPDGDGFWFAADRACSPTPTDRDRAARRSSAPSSP